MMMMMMMMMIKMMDKLKNTFLGFRMFIVPSKYFHFVQQRNNR